MSIYEHHNLENDVLPFIYNELTYGASPLSSSASNWHENIEIQYIYEGEGRLVNNGEVIDLSCGDIAVINSNHLHTLLARSERMLCRYLIIDRSFCLLNGIDTNKLKFVTRLADPTIAALMSELHSLYSRSEGHEYRVLSIRSTVLSILNKLCVEYTEFVSEPPCEQGSLVYVKRAVDYIRASYAKSFSLEDVAEFVGVNKCYLSREFHRYIGCTFVEYVNRTRCRVAEQLLADSRVGVCEAGALAGFSNRSYFAKTFQRYTGISPAEYRRAAFSARHEAGGPKSTPNSVKTE